ncbi:Receptor-like serine/threonine-protein kinase [Heracleum sosnowskyi]|uniref:Receptor-like serine/threonine-protein kinase n=1 Tax=Heracleum sosnowskyi TaxID=360622 RepID=A0AAD8IAC5_9APIA|nr:Receptor-like serine/threonine-protein kinase [Heracleum sosnowskyi]
MANTAFILFFFAFSAILLMSTAVDIITVNQTVTDEGNGTIDSASEVFRLGFFSPGKSKNRYLGIWYMKILPRVVVWVANRDTPLSDTSGVLRVESNGRLVLSDGSGRVIWSTNSTRSVVDNTTVAQLFDSGNLVIRNGNDGDPKNYFWESFDYPGNHLLPTQKIGFDFRKGLERYLSSWRSPDDPAPGNYSFRINIDGYPQLMGYNHSNVIFRIGPWDSVEFSGLRFLEPDQSFIPDSALNKDEIYYSYNVPNSPVIVRLVLSPDGVAQILAWNDKKQIWTTNLNSEQDVCEKFALCGPYGTCDSRKAGGDGVCGCVKGFEPKDPKKWKSGNWSDGCVRKTPLSCGNGDTFFLYMNGKLPDTRTAQYNTSMDLQSCKIACLNNCSCTAYSNIDVRQGGMGCLLWFNDLNDIRDYYGPGLQFYVKTADSDGTSSSKMKVIVPLVAAMLAISLGLFWKCVCRNRMRSKKGKIEVNGSVRENKREELDLPLVDFAIIAKATRNFSLNNKLGEGGFGPVYKGTLEDGQEIAVKRLSKQSRQGLDEFKNEVSVIAKLQHRNLVRLLGCCIEDGEMLLIYEYMPNKSLDAILFDEELSKTLDWPMRQNIICGIARGLLYLHQDSRLRIIHRDLKASNVLLDREMNPRISDFGMAKSFTGTQTEAYTTRVVGTFGYMSPEYALDGTFSVKSDVYSFGVLVLEIVTGKKMGRFYHSDHSPNLLSYAWTLYEEEKLSELFDSKSLETHDKFEAFRAIQIGLLCVNTYPEDRPSMSYVVSMLTCETELPRPMRPGAYNFKSSDSMTDPLTKTWTTSSISLTDFGPR